MSGPVNPLEISTNLKLLHLALGLVVLFQGSSVTLSNESGSAENYRSSSAKGSFARSPGSSSQEPVMGDSENYVDRVKMDKDDKITPGPRLQEKVLKRYRIGLGMMLLGVGLLW